MRINSINTISFQGKNTAGKNIVKSLEKNLPNVSKKDEPVQLAQKEQKNWIEYQKLKEREAAQRTMIEDLGSLWDD